MKQVDAFYKAHPSLFVILFMIVSALVGVVVQYVIDRTFVGVMFVIIILGGWFLLKDYLKKANAR